MTVKDGLEPGVEIIILNLFDGRERRGNDYETAARQAGRGKGEWEAGSEERVVRKSRLVPTPSLSKCARQDTGHPLATATPRGRQFL